MRPHAPPKFLLVENAPHALSHATRAWQDSATILQSCHALHALNSSECHVSPSSIFRHSSVALASTDSHCQKRVTAVTPNHYLSDLVCSSIKSPNHSYNVIDQTSPIKIQPKTVPKELPCALMLRLSFCLSKMRRMHSHTPHVLGKIPSQSFSRATHYMRSTPLSATSTLAHQLPCQHHTSFSDVNIQDP